MIVHPLTFPQNPDDPNHITAQTISLASGVVTVTNTYADESQVVHVIDVQAVMQRLQRLCAM
jgi:hypothetical protein